MKKMATNLLTMVLVFGISGYSLAYAEPSTERRIPAPVGQSAPIADNQRDIQDIRGGIVSQTQSIDLIREEITRMNDEIKKAQGEERSVLREQLRRKQAEMRDALESLVRAINTLESKGQDTRESREIAAAHVRQVSAWLKVDIRNSLDMLAGLEEQIKTASESDLPELKQQIVTERQAVDEQLLALLENSDRLELLGLDSTSDLRYLDETLMRRADHLAARLQYLVQQRDGLRKQVAGAGDEETKRLKEMVSSLDGRITSTADNLKITIELMNERKLDAAAYKQILISSTGEISKEIFESEVALGLLQKGLDSGKEWLINNGPQWAFKLIVLVLIITVFLFFSKIVKGVARKALASSRLNASKLLQELFVSLAGKAVFLVGVLIALAQVGVQIGPVLAGLGIVGFIIGFALQETLSNFASGIMILIYRPFDVGDAIEAGGVSGQVKMMNLVSTTITTFDNQRVIVPNKKIWGDVIRNMNAEKIRRIDLLFGIGYDDDIERAEQVLNDIVDRCELVLDDPAPVVRLHTLGESSIDFIVRPWVKTSDYWMAYWHITKSVKKRFDEEGISIPFPQQDMHVYHHGKGPVSPTP